jgi:hypothetical protein
MFWGGVVVGVLLGGVLLSVLSTYACTEYLLVRLDVRQRILVGQGSPLLLILAANLASFLVVWLSAMVLALASEIHVYDLATIFCIFAQAIWLTQHLWMYYRDHLRMRYE